jgi:hypothetical protein
MSPAKRLTVIEESPQVPVNRARELSNKLSLLPKNDLILLRRIYDSPEDNEAQEIISKAVLDDYSIQELRVALAMLDGVHKLPLSEKPLGFENIKPWHPVQDPTPLPPQRIITPSNDTPSLPSAKTAQEISDILVSIPYEDFKWLIKHFGKPQDLRSRLIIIKNRLYHFKWEDVAATIAALQRTLPPSESE